ncbi:HTH-type dhaKLM operon transcriptional activator DhaS [compost metagenome]
MSSSFLTKKALAHSLKSLMEHIPLNKISVQRLVDDCGLNRQTFYYHFQDIFDLLGWIYRTEAVGSIASYRSYNTWTDGFVKIFRYIESNKAFCCNTLDSLGRNHLDTYLYAVTNDLIMGVIQEISSDINVSMEDKQFIANFYTLAFTGLVIQWMKEGMTGDPQEMVHKLSTLVEGNFINALRKYEQISS